MPRLPFNDFLNTNGGPSTPRGRGGSRGGRGRGGGRGGTPLGGSAGTGKSSFKTDYSNMPFDYTAINKQGYAKMEGFQVAPFGPNTGQPGTPSNIPRGRGRGAFGARGSGRTPRAGLGPAHLNDTPIRSSPLPSGAGTPVTGLGFRKGKGKEPIRVESTVGRGIGTNDVVWGGRKGAPMFVKAGELFKDGEVDLVTHEEDTAIEVETVSRSETMGSRPDKPGQAIEAEIPLDPASSFSPDSVMESEGPDRDPLKPSFESSANLYTTRLFASMVQASSSRYHQAEQSRSQSEQPEPVDAQAEGEGDSSPSDFLTSADIAGEESSSSRLDPTRREPGDAKEESEGSEVEEEISFFIDTAPEPTLTSQATSASIPTAAPLQYTTQRSIPIGSQKQAESEEEQIVFKPKVYQEPIPISVPVPKQAIPAVPAVPIQVVSASASSRNTQSSPKTAIVPPSLEPIQAFIDPRAVSGPNRKAKKAAKRETRKARQKKSFKKRAGLRDDFGAEEDIDWGSDGPPDDLMRVEGPEGVELDVHTGDRDMEILRDYLAGTLLNAADEEAEMEEEARAIAASLFIEDAESEDTTELIKGKFRAPQTELREISSANGNSSKGKAKTKIAPSKKPRPDTWDAELPSEEEDSINESDFDYGSDESSELGDIQAIMDALGSDEEEEDEDEVDGDDVRFKGRSAWTSEDESEWFIRNMEEALSPDASFGAKKAKKGLFTAIENGSFDFDLPTVPAPKSKKKAQHIPEELHAQWEADRQKKAAKKQQRELDRIFAELQAYTAGLSGKKGKGKGSSKAQQAALAHLIPASASQVADMFDIQSEEEAIKAMEGSSRSGLGKMRKMLNLPPLSGFGGSGEMDSIVQNVRIFVMDTGRTTFSMPPMEKEGRQRVHMLAECFGLKSKSRGKGKARFTVLIKTARSGLHVDETRLARLVSASEFSGGNFYKALYSGKGGGVGKVKKGPIDRGTSARAREGDLVGEGAERIGQGNIGHQLLSKMGWADGDRIGRTGGLDNPIIAVVKNTKSGLGA